MRAVDAAGAVIASAPNTITNAVIGIDTWIDLYDTWTMPANTTAVFVYIYAVLYPALVRQCAAAAWPAAGAALNRIRQLVALNLVLSVAVLAAALSSR